ncbi:unnamed protein product, partial [Iphiclides podalirius]
MKRGRAALRDIAVPFQRTEYREATLYGHVGEIAERSTVLGRPLWKWRRHVDLDTDRCILHARRQTLHRLEWRRSVIFFGSIETMSRAVTAALGLHGLNEG